MTLSQIENAMSPSQDPAFGSGEQRRVYRKLGLTVKLVSDGSKTVDSVQSGSLDPNDTLVKSNKYLTSKNIGMGSSRDEIISAYGPPSQIKEDWEGNTPDEGLYYDSLRIRFFVTTGKIHQITVIF